VREEFARRVAALGRLVTRTDGAAAWWSRKAGNSVERSLVAVARRGRPELVVAFLDAVRPEYPEVMRDLLAWLQRCAAALAAEWWPLTVEPEPAAEAPRTAPPTEDVGDEQSCAGERQDLGETSEPDWTIAKGYFAHGGRRHPLNGVSLKLLKAFLTAPGRILDWRAVGFGGVSQERAYGRLSELRGALRRALDLGEVDPLPSIRDESWRLASDIFAGPKERR
jgi:hypothetical protein